MLKFARALFAMHGATDDRSVCPADGKIVCLQQSDIRKSLTAVVRMGVIGCYAEEFPAQIWRMPGRSFLGMNGQRHWSSFGCVQSMCMRSVQIQMLSNYSCLPISGMI